MPSVVVSTDSARRSAAHRQAVKVGGLVFVSGQWPFDPATDPDGFRFSIAVTAEAS